MPKRDLAGRAATSTPLGAGGGVSAGLAESRLPGVLWAAAEPLSFTGVVLGPESFGGGSGSWGAVLW